MSTYPYEHIHTYSILMNIFERLSRFDLEIHKVGHQERLAVDVTSPSTKKIINRKCSTHIKYRI
jgi:hypothetical protein